MCGKSPVRFDVGVVVVLFVSLLFSSHAGEIKVVTEYKYPTTYTVTPVTGVGPNGASYIIGGIVEPGGFETREVGVAMAVEAAVGNLGGGASALTDLERKHATGTTDLMIAAASGDYEKVRKLIVSGAVVNVRNRFGSTALMGASAGGYDEIVKLLFDRKADVNAKSNDGSTALLFAARNGHVSIVRMLLEKGVATEAADIQGMTPLMCAVRGGHTDVVELLAGKGASVNVTDRNGETPLTLASARKDEGVVQLLTRLGAQK